MRKIILNVAVSLDGFIEGPNGEFDWCFVDQDYGMKAFMERIDTIFFGRKSYELVQQMEKNPFPGKTKYVFSGTLKKKQSDIKIINRDFESVTENIKKQQGKDIWLFGGSELITGFTNAGLVDALHLAVHPIILGEGKPLFNGVKERQYFDLINTQTYSSGIVQLFYQRFIGGDHDLNFCFMVTDFTFGCICIPSEFCYSHGAPIPSQRFCQSTK